MDKFEDEYVVIEENEDIDLIEVSTRITFADEKSIIAVSQFPKDFFKTVPKVELMAMVLNQLGESVSYELKRLNVISNRISDQE